VTPSLSRSLLTRACLVLLAGGLALGLPHRLRADDQQETPNLTDATTDALQKLQPLLDAKDWSGAVNLLVTTQAAADADSYDRALVANTLAKVYFQIDDTPHAAAEWEIAIQLGEAHRNYFDPKDLLEMYLSVAQAYYQEGSTSKVPEETRALLAKSTTYVEKWLAASPKPTLEVQLFYTSILYSRATVDPKHVDQSLIQEAEKQAKIGLELSVHPQEKFYQLIVACAQQSDDMQTASRYFELMVWKYPKVAQYWQNLWYSYMNLAADEGQKDEIRTRQYYVRAINAMERAQSFGFMNKPKDNYNLFTLYYNVDQFGEATDILYKGMKLYEEEKAQGVPEADRHGIESTPDNWEHLASAYQQNNQPEKAVSALKEAEGYFPDDGALDVQLGEIYYYELQDNADAYQAFISAASKPHLAKPYTAWVFAAYTAYGLEHYKDALDAVNHAETYPEAASDAQLGRLKKGVEDGLKIQQDTGASAPKS
jgi:tetratricopeptide (TPR) repeat protein